MARGFSNLPRIGCGHRKVDANAIGFHFGVEIAICNNISAVEQVSGCKFTTALLTDYRDGLENLDGRFHLATCNGWFPDYCRMVKAARRYRCVGSDRTV